MHLVSLVLFFQCGLELMNMCLLIKKIIFNCQSTLLNNFNLIIYYKIFGKYKSVCVPYKIWIRGRRPKQMQETPLRRITNAFCLKQQRPDMPKEHSGHLFLRDKVISAAWKCNFWIFLFFPSIYPRSHTKYILPSSHL